MYGGEPVFFGVMLLGWLVPIVFGIWLITSINALNRTTREILEELRRRDR